MIEKHKFQSYTDEEERAQAKSRVIPVRVNNEEEGNIKELRILLNINSESKALKFGAEIGLNVLQALFSKKTLKYLCKEKRERLTDWKKPESQIIEEM